LSGSPSNKVADTATSNTVCVLADYGSSRSTARVEHDLLHD
jgi:hypothetical protein